MVKKLLFVLAVGVLVVSCGNGSTERTSSSSTRSDSILTVDTTLALDSTAKHVD